MDTSHQKKRQIVDQVDELVLGIQTTVQKEAHGLYMCVDVNAPVLVDPKGPNGLGRS